jgi:hypothetical protein
MIVSSGRALQLCKLHFGVLALTGVFLAGAARAQQFSADLINIQGDAAVETRDRARVLGDKVRLEASNAADGFFLVDGEKPAAYFVRPRARQFMDAKQSNRAALILVSVDPDNPCPRWQAIARQAGLGQVGLNCERLGGEKVAGRDGVSWRAVSASGQQFSAWIDRERRFPLWIKTSDGTVVTAANVRDEPQPPELFQIPPEYSKFDPQWLIDRIKQSDVWVAN